MDFTDLDGNDKYHFQKDALIAGIGDEDRSGDVTVDDTVQFGTYQDLDGNQVGTFQNDESTVGAFFVSRDNTLVTVAVAIDGNVGNVQWIANSDGEAFISQRLSPGSDPIPEATIIDRWVGPAVNLVDVDANPLINGPGAPDTTFFSGDLQTGDQAFLDVIII